MIFLVQQRSALMVKNFQSMWLESFFCLILEKKMYNMGFFLIY